MTGYTRYSALPLTTIPTDPTLDIAAWIGQRQATFRFQLINGVTGMNLGYLTPLADTPAQITHDVTRVIKRDLRLSLAAADLDRISPLTDRILPFMLIGGQAYQIGRYMFTGDVRIRRTGGDDGSLMLMDEMNLVDQELTVGYTPNDVSCDGAIRDIVTGVLLPMGVNIAASPYTAAGSWRMGSRRGAAIDALSIQGDLETPWMDNTGVMRGVRTIDPATAVPDLSFDDGYPIYAESISSTNNLLDAPNRFVVIGSGSASVPTEVVGAYEIPPSAPHSISSRGFVQQQTFNLQVTTADQAAAAARTIGMRTLPVEQVDITTPPDPRHDGYQVVRYREENWLEVAWSMQLIEGGDMTHTLRRSYQP